MFTRTRIKIRVWLVAAALMLLLLASPFAPVYADGCPPVHTPGCTG